VAIRYLHILIESRFSLFSQHGKERTLQASVTPSQAARSGVLCYVMPERCNTCSGCHPLYPKAERTESANKNSRRTQYKPHWTEYLIKSLNLFIQNSLSVPPSAVITIVERKYG